MSYVIRNNVFHVSDEAVISASSRGLLFGDGIFETIRVFNKQTPFIDDHIQRMLTGMSYLRMDIPEHFTPVYFKNKIAELIKKNELENSRIRITVTRREGGKYEPLKRSVDWIMHAEPLENDQFELNERGLQLAIFENERKFAGNLANLKTTSAAVYTLAGLYRKQMAKDDCLILNHYGRIAEAISSNVFFVEGDQIVTPPISEGCVAGVTRKNVIEILGDLNCYIEERPIELDDLDSFDCAFLTNSVAGIRWIQSIETFEYENGMAAKWMNALNNLITGKYV